MSLVDSIIAKLDEWVGCIEGGSLHQEILDLYNKGKEPTEYTMTINDPWCAAGLGAAAYAVGLKGRFPISASCDRMISWFESRGEFFAERDYKPQRGDVIFYDWDGNLSGDHVGIISRVCTSYYETIECNYTDSVAHNKVSAWSSSIRGFGVPNYLGEVKEPVVEKTWISYFSQLKTSDKATIKSFPTLSKGSKGIYVKIIQLLTNYIMDDTLIIDGEFGEETEKAVMRFQELMKLEEIDGIVGRETYAAYFTA